MTTSERIDRLLRARTRQQGQDAETYIAGLERRIADLEGDNERLRGQMYRLLAEHDETLERITR